LYQGPLLAVYSQLVVVILPLKHFLDHADELRTAEITGDKMFGGFN